MSDYLDKIQTQKKDGTPLATVPFRDSEAREDITTIQNELTTDTTTIEGNPLNFTTLSAQTAKSTILSLEPIQDLHGYDKPWVGGAGKNKLPCEASSTTVYGINFAVAENGIVTAKNVSSHLQPSLFNYWHISLPAGSYKVNGANGGSASTYYIEFLSGSYTGTRIMYITNGDNSMNLTEETNVYVRIIIANSGLPNIGDTTIFSPMIRLSTETDATFEPYENICPISGRSEIGILGCGKNILRDDKWSLNANNVFLGATGDSDYENLLHAGTYTLSVVTSKTGTSLYYAIRGGSTINIQSPYTFTVSEKGYYRFWVSNPNGILPSDVTSFQLEKNNQATTYSPYTKSTDLTISLGQTVYGGTLDVENGVLVVDRKAYKIGDLTWGYNSNYGGFFESEQVDRMVVSLTSTIGSCYTYGGYNNTNSQMANAPDFSIILRSNGSSIYNILRVKDSRYANKDNWLAEVGNETICYTLYTPIIIQLTPHQIALLKGVNNISTDGDKITLTYRDGSVATLGDLTSAVDNLDSKIDESKILTDTATGDKYILVVTNGVLSVEQISN